MQHFGGFGNHPQERDLEDFLHVLKAQHFTLGRAVGGKAGDQQMFFHRLPAVLGAPLPGGGGSGFVSNRLVGPGTVGCGAEAGCDCWRSSGPVCAAAVTQAAASHRQQVTPRTVARRERTGTSAGVIGFGRVQWSVFRSIGTSGGAGKAPAAAGGGPQRRPNLHELSDAAFA